MVTEYKEAYGSAPLPLLALPIEYTGVTVGPCSKQSL